MNIIYATVSMMQTYSRVVGVYHVCVCVSRQPDTNCLDYIYICMLQWGIHAQFTVHEFMIHSFMFSSLCDNCQSINC